MMRRHAGVLLLAGLVFLGVSCDGDDGNGGPDVVLPEDTGGGDNDVSTGAPDLVPVDASADLGEDTGPWQAPELAATVVRYELSARPASLPFPYDYYLVDDAEALSGRRVKTDEAYYSNAAVDDVFNLVAEYEDSTRLLEGFGAFAWATVELAGDVELDWHQAPAAELPDDAPVRMYRWDGEQIGEAVPFQTRMVEVKKSEIEFQYFLDAVPSIPFADGERYTIVVTRDLLDANAQPVGPDAQFLMVSGQWAPDPEADAELNEHILAERERLAPLFTALDDAGLAREDLAAAWDITVGHQRAELFAIADAFAVDPELNEVEYTFDADGDGNDDILVPGDAGFPSVENVAVWVNGRLTRRDYRDPSYHGGAFRIDDEGAPVLYTKDEDAIGFYFALPEAANDGPVPAVLVGHGIESSKNAMRRLVTPLCGAGLAVLAFDLPKHENGHDGAGVQFLGQIINPLAGRDNFRQAGIDIMTLGYLVRGWAASGLDLLPRDGGDGSGELLSSPMLYWGHSLGSMVSYVGSSLGEVDPQAVVYAVGGGGVFYFIMHFLETYNLSALVPPEYVHGIEVLAGPLFGPGDPVNYASFLRPGPRTGAPRQVLLMEVMEDDTMPENCVEAAARTMQLPQVGVIEKPVFGLAEESDGISEGAGLVQYSGSAHNLTLGSDRSDEANAQGIHFLQTFLETGTGKIIHPYPVDE